MTKEELRLPLAAADNWSPAIGETTEGLGDYLVDEIKKLPSREAFQRVRGEALEVLRQCRPFNAPDGNKTGLVIGYVQSGKTMSMTTVSALARDNGCRIIIMLAGVTINLLRQNSTRLMEQLRAASSKLGTVWRVQNSEDGVRPDMDGQNLRQAVDEWRDRSIAEASKQTFIFSVLKNHSHLQRLNALLRQADLSGIPTLIFDDEADQAGLNTNADRDEDPSTTYRWISAVRAAVPHHTYLQYTATPQAPLLISITDMLSPSFAQLLEPGDGYTGGKAFFASGADRRRVVSIPSDDLFRAGNPPSEPPESLLHALGVFFVGCAVARLRGAPRPISMLVHPSRLNDDQDDFFTWIDAIIERWSRTLRAPRDPDYGDVIEEFKAAYADLQTTDPDIPPFDDLLVPLRLSLGRVVRNKVTQDGSDVDWKNGDEHIVVGGDKLNRGYTVEGLSVTYMPRDAGGWNADTLQQRARFFGYKAPYLDLCRLYLHPDVIDAYRAYVRHEEDMRAQLAKHRGKPLRDWKRAFFLDASQRPTRQNVLAIPYYRVRTEDVWFVQRWPHVDTGAEQRNQDLMQKLERALTFGSDPRFREHAVATSTVADLFEKYLLPYEVRDRDVAHWYGHLVVLSDILADAPNTPVTVLNMSPRRDGRLRERSLSDDGIQPHQGRSAGKNGYPGDKKMIAEAGLTLQLHWLDIPGHGQSIAIALYIPEALRDDVLAQPQ